MSKRYQVDINLVNQFKDHLAWVNSLPLEQVDLVDRGRPVKLRKGSVEEFKFTGMSNTDFIRSEWYGPYKTLDNKDCCPVDAQIDPGSQTCQGCEFNVGYVIGTCGEITDIKCSHEKFQNMEGNDE